MYINREYRFNEKDIDKIVANLKRDIEEALKDSPYDIIIEVSIRN